MNRGKHAFKALGLALMAILGLMALSAAGAQAEKAGVFLVAGGEPKAGDEVDVELENNTITLLTELKGGLKVAILCQIMKIIQNKLISKEDFEVELEFELCEVNEPANCALLQSVLAEALVLVLLHKPVGGTESTYIVLEPKPLTTAFTELHFKGATCLLPTEEGVEIKGRSTLKDCENALLTEKTTHLLTELQGGTKLKFGGKGVVDEGLKFGMRPMSLDGSVNVKVLRSLLAQNWSAH